MAQKQNEEHGATDSLPSEVSMEMVYKELHTMKLLLHKIIDNQEVCFRVFVLLFSFKLSYYYKKNH
jgi:hypothetical protein